MKKKLLSLTVLLLTATVAFCGVTIRYYNKDSKDYTFKVRMDGSDKTVTFEHSRTSTVTIQGGSGPAIIETSCGKVEVKDGASIEIKDGCIKIN